MNSILRLLNTININLVIFAVVFLGFLFFRLYVKSEEVTTSTIVGCMLLLVGFLLNLFLILPVQVMIYDYYLNIILNLICLFIVSIATLYFGLGTLFLYDRKYFSIEAFIMIALNYVNCFIFSLYMK